jgi:hypothetical protein
MSRFYEFLINVHVFHIVFLALLLLFFFFNCLFWGHNMKGKIKAYSAAVNAGVIEAPDGKKYQFGKLDWVGETPPENDQNVSFSGATDRAHEVKKV